MEIRPSVTTLSADPSTSMQQAKSRLEEAMARLERAIEVRASGPQAGAGAAELDAARAEIGRLKETNRTVTARLDAAIDRFKVLLEQ
jgi:hypothetical protein